LKLIGFILATKPPQEAIDIKGIIDAAFSGELYIDSVDIQYEEIIPIT